MADEDRSKVADEMRAQGHEDAAAIFQIEGLSDEVLGLDGIGDQEPEPRPEDAEDADAEDDVSDESEEVEVEDAEDDEDSEESSDDAKSEEPAHLDLTDEAMDSLVTIKVNGEEQEVTLREALAGTMRQKAFTLKTQELAEQRKAVEQEIQAKAQERQKYAEGLQQLESVLKSAVPEEPDWDKVKAESPDEYPELFRAYQDHKKRMDAVKQEQERVQSEAAEEAQLALVNKQNERDEFLTSTVPGWDDLETARAEMADLVEYAQENFGYSLDDIQKTIDPNAFLMLRKAKLYDEMTEKGEVVRKKAKKTITLKPGSKGSGSQASAEKKKKAARSRLSKTGSLRDAADALEAYGLID